MKARLVSFGRLEIDKHAYDHDVVIERGQIARRKKGPSKAFRDRFGHTPLSAAEHIPWSGSRLIIGTGAYGQLPVMDEVYQEARRRNVEIIVTRTEDACTLLAGVADNDVSAILHITC
jgi:hypothetical protein